jgi:hypothetical protein
MAGKRGRLDMETDLNKIYNVVKQLQEIADELKIAISISVYSNVANGIPYVFLHDNTGAGTEYYDDMTVGHCDS